MNKQVIIILEGSDGSGKTTLKKEIERLSNYKFIVIDRFTGSDIVYDRMFERDNREDVLLQLEEDMSKIANVLLVYCYCDIDLQRGRLRSKGDDEDTIRSIEESNRLYGVYLEQTKFKTDFIDTSEPVQDCVNDILDSVINAFGGKDE